MSMFVLVHRSLLGDDGTVLTHLHGDRQCAGPWCVLHRPSDHHMRTWPLLWRDDRGIFERVCAHRVGHPDPDQTEYLTRTGDVGTHSCDGCCAPREIT